jgi:WD40 repeat protein
MVSYLQVAVLTGHTGMITSVHFCPMVRGNVRYLVSTSSDGSVSFWSYNRLSPGKYTFLWVRYALAVFTLGKKIEQFAGI